MIADSCITEIRREQLLTQQSAHAGLCLSSMETIFSKQRLLVDPFSIEKKRKKKEQKRENPAKILIEISYLRSYQPCPHYLNLRS